MKPLVLFVLTSDPRVSHRPAEALRIAAGVGVWQKVDIRVYLREAAVLLLSDAPGELVDEEGVARCLPILGESGQPVYVQSGSPYLAEINRSACPFQEISDGELAALAAQSNYLLHF